MTIFDILKSDPSLNAMDEVLKRRLNVNRQRRKILIKELIKMASTYNFDTEYQREAGIWSDDQILGFIDSLLFNLPIPLGYLHEKINPGGITTFDGIDGKQRFTSVILFFTNKRFKKYRDILGEEVLEMLSNETLEYDVLGHSTPQQIIRTIFIRLQNGSALKGAEVRRARDCNLSRTIIALTEVEESKLDITKFFKVKNKRKEHYDIVEQLLLMSRGGYSTGKKDVEAFYKSHGHLTEYSKEIEYLKKICKLICKCLDNGMINNVKFAKTELFVVFLVVKHLNENYSITNNEGKVADAIHKFFALAVEAKQNEKDVKLLLYNAKKGRLDDSKRKLALIDIVMPYILKFISLPPKGKPFSYEEKKAIYVLNDGIDAATGKPINFSDADIDHELPKSLGGSNKLENGRPMNSSANRGRGNNPLSDYLKNVSS